MPVFTAWGEYDEAGRLYAHTFSEGEGPPRHADGTPLPAEGGGPLLPVWRFHAKDWEDACRQYHALQGWGPYKPMEAANGPTE